MSLSPPTSIEIVDPLVPRSDEVLTPQAIELITLLHRTFETRRQELLLAREVRMRAIANGADLGFLPETAAIRSDSTWTVAASGPGLVDRRVEITGPTDRKMTVNALNSGAKVWLADFEDAITPLWENVVTGQLNLQDALHRRIDFTAPDSGKEYRLRPDSELPTIVVRPRGWHLPEKHVLVDGVAVSGSLVDFALYLSGCGQRQVDRGHGPYFYLPKMESYLEARLWNDVFNLAQDTLGLPRGTIRATVLIETYPAAFEMEEILYELRDHAAGLNAGRWDFMFSVIKMYRTRGRDYLLPDRNAVSMTVPFMRAYTDLLVNTCHRRGAHAIGGMAAFIPSRDPEINAAADAKVRADKTREAGDGFDGSWVAHPAMVELCRAAFTAVLGDRPHQISNRRDDVHITAQQLLDVAATPGAMTEAGLRNNISVAIQYLASWLRGVGAVGIFNLMEDAATAEISRSQTWQWLHNDVTLDTGELVTRELIGRLVDEEVSKLDGDPALWQAARDTFLEVAVADEFADFLTLPAYARMP